MVFGLQDGEQHNCFSAIMSTPALWPKQLSNSVSPGALSPGKSTGGGGVGGADKSYVYHAVPRA